MPKPKATPSFQEQVRAASGRFVDDIVSIMSSARLDDLMGSTGEPARTQKRPTTPKPKRQASKEQQGQKRATIKETSDASGPRFVVLVEGVQITSARRRRDAVRQARAKGYEVQGPRGRNAWIAPMAGLV